MFLFFDFPSSTLGELAGAKVGSQGKQRTGPRPCNNIKVLIQRKKIWKKWIKNIRQKHLFNFHQNREMHLFFITENHEDKPKENSKQVDGPPIFNKITIMFFPLKSHSCFFIKITFMFFSLKSHSCFFPIKYSFIIGKETNLQAHMAPFLTSVGSEMLVMSWFFYHTQS